MLCMYIRIASVRRFLYTYTTYDFMEKYLKLSLFIILILTPDFPHFYYMLGVNLGSLLYGDVSVMRFFAAYTGGLQNTNVYSIQYETSLSGCGDTEAVSIFAGCI